MLSRKLLILPIALMAFVILSCNKEEDPELDMWLERPYCNDDCVFANDGECDDGIGDATSSYCDYGTDCTDCGVRVDVRKRK